MVGVVMSLMEDMVEEVVSPVLFIGVDMVETMVANVLFIRVGMVEKMVEEVGMVEKMVEEVGKSGLLTFSVVQMSSSNTPDNSGYVWLTSEMMFSQELGADRRPLLLTSVRPVL